MRRAPEAAPDFVAAAVLWHAHKLAGPGISPGDAAGILLDQLDRGELALEVRYGEHGQVVESRLVRVSGGERALRNALLGSASHAR